MLLQYVTNHKCILTQIHQEERNKKFDRVSCLAKLHMLRIQTAIILNQIKMNYEKLQLT